ncbi:Protein CBG11469, partial [Caenorhabditis briggsae]
ISLFGTLCDIYLFYKFVNRKSKQSGFQKLCTVKTISNFIICSAFLLWVVPVTSLSLTLNSLLAVCLSCNRCYVLFFPFGIFLLRKIPVTNVAIGFCVSFMTAWGLFSTRGDLTNPNGCASIYDPNIFIWRGEISECSDILMFYIPRFVFSTTFITNSLNVLTIVRLLMEKMVGMNIEESKRRRKRWMIMFVQSMLQDCLQLIDIINSYYIWKLNEDLWFQFLSVTLS